MPQFIGRRELPRYLTLPCAGGGVLLALLGAVRVLGLAQGSLGARVVVMALLLAMAAAAGVLLARRGDGLGPLLLLPVGLAFFLRALCLDHMSLDYQDFLAQWVGFFRQNGGFAAIRLPVGNYNVPYLYFLAAISYLDIPDLYLIKLFSIAFDVVLAWGGCRLVALFRDRESPLPALAGCLLLLLPTVVANGSYWGQCDALYGALILHALADAMDRHPGRSVVLLAVAFSFKLQAIFLVPLWCAFWFARRVKFWHLLLFPATYLITILPALLLGKPLSDTLGVYLGQMGVNSALSFNAPSVYQLIPYGTVLDETLAARLGIVAAFVLVLGVLGALFPFRRQLDNAALLTAGVVMAVGVPFLLPYMHDRYFFLADALTLVWACAGLGSAAWAALVQLSSLSAYFTYFRMKFTFPLRLGRGVLAMGLETLMMLAVLVWMISALAGRLAALPRPTRTK